MTASKCSLFEDMLRCGALRVVYIDNQRPRQDFVCILCVTLCALCLCGKKFAGANHHRDTEHTEIAQRMQLTTLPFSGFTMRTVDELGFG